MNALARLDPWIAEFKEIIDLSLALFKGDLESGSRIAVVLLDNCVEFMFKSYLRIVKRAVGASKRFPIKPNDWDSEISRRFDRLADAMKKYSTLSHDLIDSAEHYHTIRNDLYHTSTPFKTNDAVYKDQLKLVLVILEKLYSVKHGAKSINLDDIKPVEADPEQQIASRIKSIPGRHDALTLSIVQGTPFAQTIRLILFGHQKLVGTYATVEKISDTLKLNMMEVEEPKIRAALAELKQRKQVKAQGEGYGLTNFGHKAMIDAMSKETR